MIGEPQPAIVGVERAGLIHGTVLDVGCGTGEHTILLMRLGYDVLGVVLAAIEQARENATAKGVDAGFEVADAMNLGADPRYDTTSTARCSTSSTTPTVPDTSPDGEGPRIRTRGQ